MRVGSTPGNSDQIPTISPHGASPPSILPLRSISTGGALLCCSKLTWIPAIFSEGRMALLTEQSMSNTLFADGNLGMLYQPGMGTH